MQKNASFTETNIQNTIQYLLTVKLSLRNSVSKLSNSILIPLAGSLEVKIHVQFLFAS